MKRLIFPYIMLGILIAGCNLSTPAPSPTPPPANGGNIRLAQVQVTPAPTQNRNLQPIPTKTITPTPIPEPTATSIPYICDVADDETTSARHISAVVNVDYATKLSHVDELITFTNREETALETIVLDVQANQWQNGFVLEGLSVNDLAVTHELIDNRLDIALPTPLEMGCQLTIKLSFRAQPGAIRDGLSSYRGFFGYSPRQLNIGHFIPTVAARIHDEWQIHEPIGIGEQLVNEVADWDVVVSVENARDSLQIASPGTVVEIDILRWQITLPKSRDFAISMSEDFVLHEKEVPGNVTVAVYSFPDAVLNTNGVRLDGAQHALDEASKAVTFFQELYGDY